MAGVRRYRIIAQGLANGRIDPKRAIEPMTVKENRGDAGKLTAMRA
jgi:hypothetical protein